MCWRVDSREFARGNRAQWLPWPGRHVVQLLDVGGQVAKEIRIEVRGAGVRALEKPSGAAIGRLK